MATLSLRRARGIRGAELVEFALVLPLLLVVFAAIIDFGFLFQRYLVVTNAAREAARMAALPGYTTSDVQDRARQYVLTGLGLASDPPGYQANVQAGTAGAPAYAVRTVTVQLTYNYLVLGPIMSLVGGGPFGEITLTARSTMRVEAGS
jgi:Flp pilus assembly protein TadG